MPLKAAGATLLALFSISLLADEPQLKQRPPLPPNGTFTGYRVAQERIPVKFLNTVTIHGPEGDLVFLQTTFPVMTVGNRIVIPARSYIDAEVTTIRPSRRVKGRAELYVRLGQLTLPGGAQRPLRADSEAAHPAGIIEVPFTMRGGDVVVVPGTTAEIVLVDAILFRTDEVEPPRRR
jgi:hypothetical protein